ncbi:MAG: hypothetical protein IPK94_05095 [Saprospiraceae bacterium]|nr:hypothetical protein [Saprospiraceae bacterium]
MKKISLAILAVVYLATTSGVMVHTHYCMGHLADWGFGAVTQEICNFCGMELHQDDASGCCRVNLL